MESNGSDVSSRSTGEVMAGMNGPAASGTTTEDHGSCGSGSSSEDEDVGEESEESEGSGPDSTDGEHPNGEGNEWSDDSESSVASSEEVGGAEQILFPAVLPASSVKFMAQTVGCNLASSTAAALGHLAMNNLRRLMMIANQLRKHDQSQGLSADHVAMAEKLMGNQSFGYRSTYSLSDFKHIGKGLSVLQDSRQIDLIGTTAHARKNPKPLRKMSRMLLSHHRLPTSTVPFGEGASTVPAEANIPVEEFSAPKPSIQQEVQELSDSASSSYFVSDEEVKETPRFLEAKTSKALKFRKRNEVLSRRNGGFPAPPQQNLPFTKITSNLEKLIERVLVLNEDLTPPAETEENGAGQNHIEVSNGVVVGIEWVDYMKVFMISFFHRSLEISTGSTAKVKNIDDSSNSSKKVQAPANGDLDVRSVPPESPARSKRLEASPTDFKIIIEDMTAHGVFPVLGIILNFFNDYMEGRFGDYDLEGLQRTVDVLEASLRCPARTDTVYFHKIFKTLLKLISIPPLYELHPKIAQVFSLLIKRGGKEFSAGVSLWTCEFITETLQFCTTSCLHHFDLNTTLMNLALSLIIGLDGLGIKLILELEWHTLVLEIVQAFLNLRSQQAVMRDSSPGRTEPMDTETPHEEKTQGEGGVARIDTLHPPLFNPQLEETLMVFFRLILKEYKGLLPAETIQRIHSLLEDTFGERMVPFVTLTLPDSLPRFRKRKIMTNQSSAAVTKRLRNIPWKTKLISIGKIPGMR